MLEPQYVGTFLLLAVVSSSGAGVLLGVRVPTPVSSHGEAAARCPLRAIVLQPGYLVALFGAATGYGIMILAMTIAMIHHELSVTATVIQLHVLGMFVPSFFISSLIQSDHRI